MSKLFITPNDTIGACDSESIQNAVDTAKKSGINKVVIPRMNDRTGEAKWVITETVKLPSDFMLVLDNCFMQMADDVVGGFFKSENLFTESGTDPDATMHNIHIRGEGNAVLDGGKPTAINEETQRDIGTPVRLNSPIFFMNVEGFSVENVSILHQRYWGMRFQFCSKGIIRNIFFDICRDRRNQDGINLRNGCHDILIENVHGQTGDDMIALSAIDNVAKPPFEKYDVIVKDRSWDIHDVTIRNISGAAILHPLVTLRNHNGAKIYNIHIENLRDTAQTQPAYEEGNPWPHDNEKEYVYGKRFALVLIGSNTYYTTPSVMGDTHDITIKDICCSYSASAVTMQSTVKNCRISGVHAYGKCRTILTSGINDWGDDVLGVKLDNVIVDNVQLDTDYPDAAVIECKYMREGDYIKRLMLSNIVTDGAAHLARVHKRAETVDIRLTGASDCPTDIIRVEPPEVKRCDIKFKPFVPNIERKYN